MNRWRAGALIALVGVVVWVQHGVDLRGPTSIDALRAAVRAYAPYGPLLFIGVCIGGIMLQLPPLIPIAAGGLVFEGLQAIAYGWVASIIGTTATFLAVRYLARDLAQRALAVRFARLRSLDDRLERNGFVTVLTLRLLLCLSPPLTWALGASRVRLHAFVAGTALGALPGLVATVLFTGAMASRGPEGQPWAGRAITAGAVMVGALAVAAAVGRRMLSQDAGPRV